MMLWLIIGIGAFAVLAIVFWRFRPALPFNAHDWCTAILAAGHQSGRPKGLTWIGCQPTGDVVTLPNQGTVFAGYEIRFEVIPGSDMEGIDAATIPRPVTVVFERFGRSWRMTRPPIFNLSPGAVCDQFMNPRSNQPPRPA